jgi:hypothetical protein
MNEFKTGDLCRFKNVTAYQINRISGGEINIFKISNRSPTYVEINNCEERIPFSEIEPIPINGVADFQIYYDPIIAANFIADGQPTPIQHRDKSYYLEAFKRHTYKGKNLNDLVKEQNLKYVHEVQHFLRQIFKKSYLRIDAI